MVDQVLLLQAKSLDVADRVELINELWDSIDTDELPVTQETAALIDERLREANAAPLHTQAWYAEHAPHQVTRFLEQLATAIERVRDSPHAFRLFRQDARRATRGYSRTHCGTDRTPGRADDIAGRAQMTS